jgi:uncharacterized membrane protein
METIRSAIEWAAVGIDILAVLVIVAAVAVATVRWGPIRARFHLDPPGIDSRYKRQVRNGLLTGLDLLVASDVIRTVALESTLGNVATLGLLVLVRILLTWSLVVELEGRWPWQPRRAPTDTSATETCADRSP